MEEELQSTDFASLTGGILRRPGSDGPSDSFDQDCHSFISYGRLQLKVFRENLCNLRLWRDAETHQG